LISLLQKKEKEKESRDQAAQKAWCRRAKKFGHNFPGGKRWTCPYGNRGRGEKKGGRDISWSSTENPISDREKEEGKGGATTALRGAKKNETTWEGKRPRRLFEREGPRLLEKGKGTFHKKKENPGTL